MVGIPRMPNRRDRFGALSLLTLTSLSRPGRSVAICSTMGETIRQGPHHGAQKSTSTGKVLCSTTAGNSASLLSVSQGSVAPQLPQCGTPLAVGGTRFILPQFGQRTNAGSFAMAFIASRPAGNAYAAQFLQGRGRQQHGRSPVVFGEQVTPLLHEHHLDAMKTGDFDQLVDDVFGRQRCLAGRARCRAGGGASGRGWRRQAPLPDQRRGGRVPGRTRALLAPPPLPASAASRAPLAVPPAGGSARHRGTDAARRSGGRGATSPGSPRTP